MTATVAGCVKVTTSDGVAQVTLNRPEAGNALSLEMQNAIVATFRDLAAMPAVGAIVLHGAGDRIFCAGLDLGELARGVDIVNAAPDPVAAIANSTKPVIAAVNGAAVTGGLELMLACDFAFASETARFADTHARMGVMPGWGLSQRLSRVIGVNRALEMSLSGCMIDARTALDWGLVNGLHAPETLVEDAMTRARVIASWDPAFIAKYRALIRQKAYLPLDEALQAEAEAARQHNRALDPTRLSSRGLKG